MTRAAAKLRGRRYARRPISGIPYRPHRRRSCCAASSFHCRLGNRRIDAEDWRVGCAGNGRDETARPGPRRSPAGHGRRGRPTRRPSLQSEGGRERLGHAEADDAAVALADSAFNDGSEVAPGIPANDQHTRGPAAILAPQPMPTNANDDAAVSVEQEIGDRAGVVALIQALFGEKVAPPHRAIAGELKQRWVEASPAGEKPGRRIEQSRRIEPGCRKAIAPRQRSRLNHAPAEIQADKPP